MLNKLRTLRERRGSNLIEFALTMPIFIGMMFLIVDFGWYFGNHAILDIAVHAGCREASLVDPLTGDYGGAATAKIKEILAIVPAACATDCVISITSVGDVPARSVVCSITATHKAFINFNVDTAPTSFNYGLPPTHSSLTQMRFEWQRTE